MTKAFNQNPAKFLAVRAGLASVLALAIASQPAMAQDDTAPAEEAAETETGHGDIIVTATKRGGVQALQDVATSIAAFGEDTLAKMGAVEFTDFSRSVVGLNAIDVGPGQKRYLIRGVNAPGEATVGLYVDNIPMTGGGPAAESAGDGQPDIDLYDVQQIEVLRGPQGTLYGSSSVSGIIRMVTNRPELDVLSVAAQGDLSTTRHGDPSYSIKGLVNIPVVNDVLGVRVVGYHGVSGGFVDSVTLKDANGKLLQDINRHRRSGARVSAKLQLGPSTELLGQFFYQDVHSAARNAHNPVDSDERVGPPFIKREVSPGVFVSDNRFFVPAVGNLRSNTLSLEPYNERLYLGGLSLVHEYDDFAELTVAYSFQDRKVNSLQDSSPPHDLMRRFGNCVLAGGCPGGFAFGSPAYGASLAIQNGVFSPNGRVVLNTLSGTTMHSIETRLASTWDKPINYVVGMFAQDRTQDVRSTLYHTLDSGLPNYNGPKLVDRLARNKTKQLAAFGELYWEVVDGLELMGGVRWFKTSRNQQSVVNVPFLTSFVSPQCDSDGDGAISHSQAKAPPVLNPINPATGLPYVFNYGDNSCYPLIERNSPGSEDGVIKKFQVTYRPTDDISLFAAYAEGYRAGGTNAVLLSSIPPFFEHDRTREYSLGIKTGWFDNNLTVNAGAYQIDWYDQQTVVAITTQFNALVATKTPDGGPVSRSRGIELELAAQPFDGLDLGMNVTFLKTKLLVNLIDVVPASLLAVSTETPPVRGAKGEPLLGAPKHAGNAFAQYNWSAGGDWSAYVRGDLQFQSEVPMNNYNPARNTANRPYVFGNLRVGMENDRWSLAVYVKNVTNKTADLFIANNLQAQNRITVNQPRTVGLTVGFKM